MATARVPQLAWLPTFNAGNSTRYISPFGSSNGGSTNANQTTVTCRTAGTYSLLYVRILTNTLTNSATFRSNKNAAAGNQSVLVGAGATGEFQDATGADDVVSGDTFTLQIITTTGGTSIIPSIVGVAFQASSETVSRHMWSNGGAAALAITSSTTFRMPLNGGGTPSSFTSESQTQAKVHAAYTWKNLAVRVSANAHTTSPCIFRSRKNSANGNQSVSVPASTSGYFEDTTNTDTLASGDMVCYHVTTAGGTGNITVMFVTSELLSTNLNFLLIAHTPTGVTVTSDLGFRIAGPLASGVEPDISANALVDCTVTRLTCRTSANTTTIDQPLTLRKNQANTAVSILMPASTSGEFEDTTHSVDLTPSDEINYLAETEEPLNIDFHRMGIQATGVSVATEVTASFIPSIESLIALANLRTEARESQVGLSPSFVESRENLINITRSPQPNLERLIPVAQSLIDSFEARGWTISTRTLIVESSGLTNKDLIANLEHITPIANAFTEQSEMGFGAMHTPTLSIEGLANPASANFLSVESFGHVHVDVAGNFEHIVQAANSFLAQLEFGIGVQQSGSVNIEPQALIARSRQLQVESFGITQSGFSFQIENIGQIHALVNAAFESKGNVQITIVVLSESQRAAAVILTPRLESQQIPYLDTNTPMLYSDDRDTAFELMIFDEATDAMPITDETTAMSGKK